MNFGCTPTKNLVAAARAIHQASRGDYFGFETGSVEVNYPRVRSRMNEVRNSARKGLVDWMENTDNVSLIREWGQFEGPKILRVGEELIIGAAILGPGGDEIINMFAAIMYSGIPCKDYREVVLVHPTVSELMPLVLDGLEEV